MNYINKAVMGEKYKDLATLSLCPMVGRSLPLDEDASIRPVGSDFVCFIVQRREDSAFPAYKLKEHSLGEEFEREGRNCSS